MKFIRSHYNVIFHEKLISNVTGIIFPFHSLLNSLTTSDGSSESSVHKEEGIKTIIHWMAQWSERSQIVNKALAFINRFWKISR